MEQRTVLVTGAGGFVGARHHGAPSPGGRLPERAAQKGG